MPVKDPDHEIPQVLAHLTYKKIRQSLRELELTPRALKHLNIKRLTQQIPCWTHWHRRLYCVHYQLASPNGSQNAFQ